MLPMYSKLINFSEDAVVMDWYGFTESCRNAIIGTQCSILYVIYRYIRLLEQAYTGFECFRVYMYALNSIWFPIFPRHLRNMVPSQHREFAWKTVLCDVQLRKHNVVTTLMLHYHADVCSRQTQSTILNLVSWFVDQQF
jgi:hypothetical protein